jgi:putative FmdB family regulatory protein
MPFYEYECSQCKYYSEVMQKISDPPLRKCPSCGRSTFKKLVSAPVFRLKGSGWYETDFKSDKEGKRNLVGEDKKPDATKAADAKPADAAGKKDDAGKGESAKGESAKEAPKKSDDRKGSDTRSTASRRGASAARAKAPARKAPARKPSAGKKPRR